MEAHSFRRIFSCTKTRILGAIAIALLFFFAAPTPKALADYSNHINLFDGLGTSTDPTLSVLSTIRRDDVNPGRAIFDFKFNFQAAFQTTSDRDAEWHWDHIYKNKPNTFILRVCDLDTAGAVADTDTCIYTPVPSAAGVSNSDVRVTGEPMCKVVNGNTVCSLPTGNEAWPKIYNFNAKVTKATITYTGGGAVGTGGSAVDTNNDTVASTGDPRYQFNVIFGSDDFKTISTGATVNLRDKFKIGNTTQYKAEIWYCGESDGDDEITEQLTNSYTSGTQVSTLNNLCGDKRPYFKIASSAPFQMPPTLESAIAETGAIDTTGGATVSTNTKEPPSSNLPNCHILNGAGPGEGSFVGCFAWLAYYVIYTPIKWFAGLLGMLFDFFLGYSLSDASYRADFAVRGWQIVRDISNIFFIIILVWTGLSAVFNTGVNMKKVVSNLILNALIINFSLFGTRVIIDVANVVARVFYKSVHVCEGPCEKNADGSYKNLKTGPGGVTPLSEKIIGSFNPQRIFSTAILNADNATKSNVTNGVNGTLVLNDNDATGEEENPLNRNDYATYYIIVSLIAAAILIAVAMMFWKTAFFFLGRVIGLYVAMIFAPFAILTRGNMPLVGGIKDLSWDSWLKDLTNYAMLAPIFVFFLYVIYSFLDTDFLKISFGDLATANFMTVVISITVPMLIVYFMVQQGVNIAQKYAGKIGELVQSGAMKVAGFAGGAALGGTALLGGRVLGAAATKLNSSRTGAWLRDKGKNNWFARRALEGINKASAGSYDVRQTSLAKNLFGKMGINTDQKGLNALKGFGLGLGTDQRKGGYESDVKRRQEYREKEAKLLEEKMSDEQIKKYNDRKKKEYEERIDKLAEKAMQVHSGKTKEDIEIMKTANPTAYNAERAAAIAANTNDVKTAIDKVKKPEEMKSVVEMNTERRKVFAEGLEKGGKATQALKWLSQQGKFGEKASAVLGGTIGAVIGEGIRSEGDKKAAKKIKEKNKIEQDLQKIEKTLNKGFQDLIAVENYQNSAKFRALTPKQQQDILTYGSIQDDPSNPNNKDYKGKSMYDILDDADKQNIDADIERMKKAKEGPDKEKREEYEEMVKVIEGSRFDMKQIDGRLKAAKRDYRNIIANSSATQAQREKAKKDYLDAIKEKQKALKHKKTWDDVNKHIEDQKKKLKGEEEKK